MKKFLILILSLPFLAASCDLGFGSFDIGSGSRGVYKSEDAGETFAPANRVLPKNDIAGLNVSALAFNPSNTDILYLGANSGIFKSEDGAKSWRYILSNISIFDIAVDPYQPDLVYAAGISGQNGKIIKSLDGGTSWVDMYTEPSKNNPVIAIAVPRINNKIVVAGLSSGQVIRSPDSGETWQASANLANKMVSIRFGLTGTAYALTQTKGLNRSTDQGLTWDPTTDALTKDTLTNPGQTLSGITGFGYIGLDERQSGVIYLGTDQGLYRSVNDGGNWSFMALPVKSGSLRVSAITVNPANSNNLFASIGATLFESNNGGVTWETKVLPTNARIRIIQINPSSQNIIYLGLTNQ